MSTNKGFQGWEPEVLYECKECFYCLSDNEPIDKKPLCPSGHGVMPYRLLHHGDEKLLRYLYEHKHMTPFEMAGMTIEVQAPIFVFREWHRHRTQSYNELSARYTPMPDVNYVPTVERLMMTSEKNKQAQGMGGDITEAYAGDVQRALVKAYSEMELLYKCFLNSGVPKELARLIIPVGRYSRMRASANLRNWLGFLTLRMDEAAQWEIRQYANVVGKLVSLEFPRAWELFNGGRA